MLSSVILRIVLIIIILITIHHPPTSFSVAGRNVRHGAPIQPFAHYDSHIFHQSFIGPKARRKSRAFSNRITKNQVTIKKLLSNARGPHARRAYGGPSAVPSPSRSRAYHYPSPTPKTSYPTTDTHTPTPTPTEDPGIQPTMSPDSSWTISYVTIPLTAHHTSTAMQGIPTLPSNTDTQ
ncbi:hypothetical protein CROQUDRAFT_654136 [Cronartium quercuum f. sp. fusiforme G11]|uniref:Uncharacterized protein n=1 Tax=Cronartium quercuum f. sp. fusiforme G11 TaxID=708437 RepID=A0A9P6NP02_9BASI|nr:hypothetical protein CROQUDRAFT_654136 [Cronartium quercuum f. sp. fusiforme G11]